VLNDVKPIQFNPSLDCVSGFLKININAVFLLVLL
jgi:hypothetical protein